MDLSISHLWKTYPNGVVALRDVSLSIPPGLFGLLGPNGAGKSTLMRILSTLQEADAGAVRLGPIDVLGDRDAVRRTLGYLPQEFGVYPKASAESMLDHFALLKGITSTRERRDTVAALLQQTNLYAARKQKLGGFSGGMRQRFGIAVALIGNPRLIIVDEPTAGLDPAERARFLNLLSELGENAVVILSTHIVEDVSDLCTRMAIIEGGRILLEGEPARAVEALRGRVWRRQVDRADLPRFEQAMPVISTTLVGGRTVIHVHADAAPDASFEPVEPDLKDVYFTVIRGIRVDPAAARTLASGHAGAGEAPLTAAASSADARPSALPAPGETSFSGATLPADTSPTSTTSSADAHPSALPARGETSFPGDTLPADASPSAGTASTDAHPSALPAPGETSFPGDTLPTDASPTSAADSADADPSAVPAPGEVPFPGDTLPADASPGVGTASADAHPSGLPSPGETSFPGATLPADASPGVGTASADAHPSGLPAPGETSFPGDTLPADTSPTSTTSSADAHSSALPAPRETSFPGDTLPATVASGFATDSGDEQPFVHPASGETAFSSSAFVDDLSAAETSVSATDAHGGADADRSRAAGDGDALGRLDSLDHPLPPVTRPPTDAADPAAAPRVDSPRAASTEAARSDVAPSPDGGRVESGPGRANIPVFWDLPAETDEGAARRPANARGDDGAAGREGAA